MSITPLTPPESARIADSVYAGLQSDDIDEFAALTATRLPQGFAPTGGLITARTGTSRTSNFAAVLNRGSTGEKVVTIRGTEFTSKQDWMTNVNIGVIPGPTAFPVHAGFGFTYNSMKENIRAGVRGTSTVHVCGHSLGGALATICAADLTARGHTCYLYTYGAPRVAPTAFTGHLSSKLSGRIYRVHDRGDPVPMIPLFPFLHAPLFGSSFLVGPNRSSISADHHAMDKSYIVSADRAGTWSAMRTAFDDARLQFGPSYWLEKAGEATRIPGAGMGLWALGKALEAILKVIGIGVQALIGSPLTVVDMLVWALQRALEIGSKIAGWVMRWLRTALRWMGRAVEVGETITQAFLRWVLDLFMRAMNMAARSALDVVRRRVV